MVTNRHMIDGRDSVVVRFKKLSSDDLVTIDVSLVDKGEKCYSVHPDNDIDIAVILLAGPFFKRNGLLLAAIDIKEQALSSSDFISEGGSEGSFVYMLVYHF